MTQNERYNLKQFLNLKTTDFWGQVILCCGGWERCPLYCRMLSSLPGQYLLDTRSTCSPNYDNPKFPRYLPLRSTINLKGPQQEIPICSLMMYPEAAQLAEAPSIRLGSGEELTRRLAESLYTGTLTPRYLPPLSKMFSWK